jgi:basic membrane lipoprotein Med (substrate-binding protein (PBP1-ABC) superfamily)
LKITKYVCFDQEVEIDITVEEITKAIYEDPDCMKNVLYGLNNIGVFLRAIPDSAISKLNESQRKIIREFITEQVARF